jgi:hypothetical protein
MNEEQLENLVIETAQQLGPNPELSVWLEAIERVNAAMEEAGISVNTEVLLMIGPQPG